MSGPQAPQGHGDVAMLAVIFEVWVANGRKNDAPGRGPCVLGCAASPLSRSDPTTARTS